MKKSTITLIALLYSSFAIPTFGKAAAEQEQANQIEWQECRADRRQGVTCIYSPPPAWAVGLTAAIFWPLYWSWEAQS